MYIKGYDNESHKQEKMFIRMRSCDLEDRRRYEAKKQAMFKEFEDRLAFHDAIEKLTPKQREYLNVDTMEALRAVISQYQMYRQFCERNGDPL